MVLLLVFFFTFQFFLSLVFFSTFLLNIKEIKLYKTHQIICRISYKKKIRCTLDNYQLEKKKTNKGSYPHLYTKNVSNNYLQFTIARTICIFITIITIRINWVHTWGSSALISKICDKLLLVKMRHKAKNKILKILLLPENLQHELNTPHHLRKSCTIMRW